MQYYTPITLCVRIENWADIQLNLLMRMRCQPIGEDVQISVFFASQNSKHADGLTQLFRVTGIFFEDSPYRKSTLWLERKDLYAIIVLDLANLGINKSDTLHCKSITLSPVPFGMDGKPKIPCADSQLRMFLCVAGCVIDRAEVTPWNAEEVATSMPRFHVDMSHFSKEQALFYLSLLEKLQAIEKISDNYGGIYKRIMSATIFQNTFGFKFPVINPFG